MIPSDDVLAGLPAPLDDEPPSVRQDIADELADHLACAYRRELLKTADEPTAQQRVLDRFGDPRRIAYQLWFQALWGRIMLHRFTRVWQGLKIAGGLVALFLIVRMAEQQSALHSQIQFMTANYNAMQSQTMGTRNLLEQVLSRLPQPPQPQAYESAMGGDAGMAMSGGSAMMGMGTGPMTPGSEGMMPGAVPVGAAPPVANPIKPNLIVRLTMEGDDQQPASGCHVFVESENNVRLNAIIPQGPIPGTTGGPGSMMGMESGSGSPQAVITDDGLTVFPEMKGIAQFSRSGLGQAASSLEPGRYTIVVTFPDGRRGTRTFAILPHNSLPVHEEQIICPRPCEFAYLVLRATPLPQQFIDAQMPTSAHLLLRPRKIGNVNWLPDGSPERVPLDIRVSFDDNGFPYTYVVSPATSRAGGSINVKGLPIEQRFLKVVAGEYDGELSVGDGRLFVKPIQNFRITPDVSTHTFNFVEEDVLSLTEAVIRRYASGGNRPINKLARDLQMKKKQTETELPSTLEPSDDPTRPQ